MKKILIILLLQMAIAFNVFAQGEGDRIVNPTWKLSSGALTPTVSTWTLTLPATTFSPSIITPLIIGGADTISTLTYKTTTGVGKTGARHIFQVGNNGATEAMTILNNGFMGIGISAPTTLLEVNGDMFANSWKIITSVIESRTIGTAPAMRHVASSATNPGFVFGNDYDTGIGLAGANILSLIAGGTNVLNVTTNNIGIGTATPLHKLSGYSTTATNLNAFNFVNNTINKVTSIVAQAIDTSSFSLNFSSLGSPKLSLKGKTGNSMIYVDSVGVGIGTASPAAKLDIYDGGKIILNAGVNPELTIGNNTATNSTTGTASLVFLQANTAAGGKIVSGRDDIYLTGASRISNLQFYTSSNAANTEKMRITNIGNLGLGTTTPYAQYSQVGATPIWYATDSDFNLHRTTLAFATDTSAIKIDASTAQPIITFENTTGNGFALSTVAAGGASFDGNVGISVTTFPATLAKGLTIANGTAPTAKANSASLYVVLGEMWVYDSTGTATQISPHNKDGDWVFNSYDVETGERTYINMITLVETVEALSGKTIIVRDNVLQEVQKKDAYEEYDSTITISKKVTEDEATSLVIDTVYTEIDDTTQLEEYYIYDDKTKKVEKKTKYKIDKVPNYVSEWKIKDGYKFNETNGDFEKTTSTKKANRLKSNAKIKNGKYYIINLARQ